MEKPPCLGFVADFSCEDCYEAHAKNKSNSPLEDPVFKPLMAMLVASITMSVNAQSLSATPASTQAPADAAPKNLVPRAKAGVRSAAAIENLALSALDREEELVKSSALSDEEKAKHIASINENRALARTQAQEVKKALTILGTPYAVVAVVVTGAFEFLPVKVGHFGVGGQGEVGFIGTVFSAGAPRWSFVGIGGPLFEFYPEVNVTQNKVGFDYGLHIKFVLANVLNRNPITRASDLEGVYLGGGFDMAFGPSIKAYAGGCFHDKEELRKEYPPEWFAWTKIFGTDIPYPTWKAAMTNKLQNCNTLMVSFSMSFNKTAPPVAIPIKPFKMWIVDTNGGDGWVPFQRD